MELKPPPGLVRLEQRKKEWLIFALLLQHEDIYDVDYGKRKLAELKEH